MTNIQCPTYGEIRDVVTLAVADAAVAQLQRSWPLSAKVRNRQFHPRYYERRAAERARWALVALPHERVVLTPAGRQLWTRQLSEIIAANAAYYTTDGDRNA
jgi:hypothetical protein